jgi:hypothetical protein
MKHFLMIGLISILVNCTNDNIIEEQTTECSTAGFVTTKDQARLLIVGKWNWIRTTHSGRGFATTTETPQSTNNKMIFEFTDEKVKIFTNDILTSQVDYTLQFWGEGSNNIDEIPVVKYGNGRTSMLFLSTSGSCLRLVNSYDDAGEDLELQRE